MNTGDQIISGLKSFLESIKSGDFVTRQIGSPSDGVRMKLKVTEVTSELIKCGPWEFSRKNGAEIDDELGWNEYRSGSYLV